MSLSIRRNPALPKEGTVKTSHFTDQRINEILEGSPLTAEERTFLIEDTPNFEECSKETAGALTTMDDKTLMQTAYYIWADYCSCL